MVGNILGEAFDPYVDEQIKVRQKVYGKTSGRNTQELTYLNGRTAWARMISSIDLIEDTQFDTGKKRLKNLGVGEEYFGDGLAKNFVLFAGTSKVETTTTTDDNGVTTNQVNNPSISDLRKGINSTNILSNAAYGLGGTEFGLQPMPHLSDISITNRGEYGAYREATINVKCYNPKQFEIINILYLSVGYTILLEWGHNCYFNNKEEFISDNATSLQQYFFDKKNANNHIGLFQAIKAKRKESDGNFDGLFGYVTNYTWTFENGVYNIDIKLTSLGSIAESLNINYLTPNNSLRFIDNPSTSQDAYSNDISALLLAFEIGFYTRAAKEEVNKSTVSDNTSTNTLDREQLEEQFQNQQKIFPETSQPSTIPSYDPNQISLDSLYNVANDFNSIDNFPSESIDFCKITTLENNDESDTYYIRFGALLEFIEKTQLIYSLQPKLSASSSLLNIDYDPENNFMASTPWMVSANPYSCIINPDKINFEDIDYDIFPFLPKFKKTEGDIFAGKIMNIFIGKDTIRESLNQNITEDGQIYLIPFLQSLCKTLSQSVGYQSDLRPAIDEENNILKIVEYGELPNKKKLLEISKGNTNYSSFDVFGYNNFNKENQSAGFVKSFNIKTQITNDIYTTAVLGAQQAGYPTKNVDPTNFSYMYRGLQDRIISYKGTPPSKTILSPKNPKPKSLEDSYKTYINQYRKLLEAESKLTFSKKEISNYLSTLKGFYEFKKIETSTPGRVSNIQYMPINFSMTLDGLSGMKIFQNFKADSKFLPYPYPEVITLNINPSIRHKISNNVWTTEVETKFVPEFVKSKNFIETTEQTTKDGFYGTNKEGIGLGVGGGGGGSEGGGSLKASGEFQQGQKAPPPLTPNADYLRGVMARLNSSGKNFKIIERYNPNLYLSSQPEFKNLLTSPVLTSNGDISEKLKNYASNVFENISSFWSSYNDENGNNPGGMQVLITAGNDTSHLESKSTAHRQGRGLDMTIRNLNGTNFTKISDTTLKQIPDYGPLDWVLTRIQELIPFDGNMGDYLDEYRYPSPGATGPHLHLNTGTENLRSHIVDGVKYTGKKYAIKLKNEGKITSKPLKQISNIPPQYFV